MLRTACILILVAGAVSLPAAADSAKHPYSINVEVAFAGDGGPHRLVESVESDLILKLRRDACFTEVLGRPAGEGAPGADLILSVSLRDYEESTVFDDSLAQSARAENPNDRGRFSAQFHLNGVARLLLPTDARPEVRSQRIGVRASGRPRFHTESELSLRDRIRDEGILDIVFAAARVACKGSTKKLDKQIAAARGSDR